MSAAVVEVKDDETFAYYAAYIKDYQKGQLLVHYSDGWRDAEWVLPAKVRPSVPLPDYSTFRPREGDDVEVQAKSQETEPFSWWRAKVKTVKGEFYLINYSDWDDNYNEICSVNQLRPPNPNVHLNQVELMRKEIKMPEEVWADDFLTPEEKAMYEHKAQLHYSEFQRETRLYSLIEDPDKHVLILVGPKKSVERAEMLIGLHFKHAAELRKVYRRTKKIDQALQESQKKIQEGVMEQFIVKPELVGLVIGKKGKNVRNVEKMPGVISVKVHANNGTITILAKTREVGMAARAALEFVEDTFPVPRKLVGRVIGPKFQAIRDIEKLSGCQRINVPDRNDTSAAPRAWADDDDVVYFNLIGTRDCVDSAKSALAMSLKHVHELTDGLVEEKQKLGQLEELHQDYGITVAGISSDGRGRGRGRGGRGGRGAAGAGRGRGRGGRGGGRGTSADFDDDEDEKHAVDDAPTAASPPPRAKKAKKPAGAAASPAANGSNGASAAAADADSAEVEPQPQRPAGRGRRNRKSGGGAANGAGDSGDATVTVTDADATDNA